MFKRILCAVDGAAHGARALTVAVAMAKAMAAELVLLVVDQVKFDSKGLPAEHKLGPVEAQRLLTEARDRAASAGLVHVSVASVASRDVGHAIIAFASEHAVDHIVVGTGEKRAATRLVVGSVSQTLVTDAHCSVTVAR